MKIKLAEESGFCFGVKKALERVNSIENKEDIYVLGKLIHNSQVIDELKDKGIKFTDNIDEIKQGTLVIPAHGVSDSIIKKAMKKGLKVIDTTCPLVKKVHDITKDLEKKGCRIIIFGDKEHSEVKGIIGNLKEPIIINDLIGAVDLEEGKYALVSQTTQDVAKFNEISKKLKGRINNLVVRDTICAATKSRQEDAEKIAREVDLMIVIGGYNSANTKRLRDICSRIVETKHIEVADELKKEWFEGKYNIGVTAGASTPVSVIKETIGKISDMSNPENI